jgi:hypothetical protein
MLRRLFKGRQGLHAPAAAERRAAVLALDEAAATEAAAELAELLRSDPDTEVRRACLERVRDVALIQGLLEDPRLGELAARRLIALGGATPETAGAAPHPALLQAELTALPEAEAAERIRALEDVDALLDLVLKLKGPLREALLAHPALATASALAALEKRSRDRDKSLNRHARRQLEQRKALQHDADATRARAEELAAALCRAEPAHTERAWRERQHELKRRLDEALDAHARDRAALAAFGDALPDLEPLRIDAATLPPLDEPEAEPVPEAAAGPDPFAALVAEFQALDSSLEAGEPFEEIAARRQSLTERWLTTADHQPPTEAQHQVFETVSHRFRELADAMERLAAAQLPALPDTALPLEAEDTPGAETWREVEQRRRLAKTLARLRRDLAWPAWAPPAPALSQVLATEQTLAEELTRADARLEQELAELDGQVAELTRAIDDGHLNDARRLLGQARSRHDTLPAQAVRSLDKALGRQAARLAELKDWQTFATTPKREALVEAMTALAEAPLAPPEQADRIKTLRRDWQALGPVTQAADGRLADRFNAAAEKAFETCRAYFAELGEQRKANLAERERICDQLERYLADTDWSNADMKAAERIMRTARDEFRRFHPVDRNPGKAVERRFEKLQGELHDRVKAAWDRNLAAKEALVAEAEALEAADAPVADKVATAKTLQRRWREVGITPRRPDQRLWQAFRAACDAIFSARDEKRQAADAALEAELERLAGVFDEFERLLERASAATASEAGLRQFLQATAEIDRLPPARRRGPAERRQDLQARYRHLLKARQREAARERIAALAGWDTAVSSAEQAGSPADLPVPDGLPAAVAEARAAASGDPVAPEQLRRLTVRAELAAGLDSPAADEALRLEVQVERLQAGLSGGGSEESAGALAEAWCRLGPKDAAAAPLRDRFFAALDQLI